MVKCLLVYILMQCKVFTLHVSSKGPDKPVCSYSTHLPGSIAQKVASLTANPGVASLNPSLAT